jgi:hypothetical protein
MTEEVTTATGDTVRVLRALSLPWALGDAADVLDGAVIIGRARVELEGGGLLHALVVEVDPYKPTRVAVFWDRYTNRFLACSVTEEERSPDASG